MCYAPVVETIVTKIYIRKGKSQNVSLAHIYYQTIWYYIESDYKGIKNMNCRGLG